MVRRLASFFYGIGMALWNAGQGSRTTPTSARLASYLAFMLLTLVLVNEGFAQIQIVNCDAPVQSRKRGIGVNSLSDMDFRPNSSARKVAVYKPTRKSRVWLDSEARPS